MPLGTEDGFDRIVNSEVQLCGFTFGLVPGRNRAWARKLKEIYPPSTWQLYPLAQQIAHDKTAMLSHDLDKFVTDRRTLSWTLGLGFAMSYRTRARNLADPRQLAWFGWVDRIQKSVCARYVGQRVERFEHQQPAMVSDDDGMIHAAYGPVSISANLGPVPRNAGERRLAGYGDFGTRACYDSRENSSPWIRQVARNLHRHALYWIYRTEIQVHCSVLYRVCTVCGLGPGQTVVRHAFLV